MKRRAFLVSLLAATAGCLDRFREDEGGDPIDPEDIEITYDELVREEVGTDDERVYVWGVVRNEGDREMSLVEIRAIFLDDDGEELDRVIEAVPDVTSGDEWEFEIEFPDFGERARRVAGYDLEIVTGV